MLQSDISLTITFYYSVQVLSDVFDDDAREFFKYRIHQSHWRSTKILQAMPHELLQHASLNDCGIPYISPLFNSSQKIIYETAPFCTVMMGNIVGNFGQGAITKGLMSQNHIHNCHRILLWKHNS